MSTLYLVRHGQASLMSEDYDRLSEVGRQQSAALGAYWAERGVVLDTVYVGPKRRHQQTLDAFAGTYRGSLPEPLPLPEYDEHSGFAVMSSVVPRLAEENPFVAEHWNNGDMSRENYLKLFRYVMRNWAQGTIESNGYENWGQFRRRVTAGIDRIRQQTGAGETVAVFTSGGAMAATVGHLLELSDVKTIEVSWIVRNTAIIEIFFNQERITLLEFNGLPHLADRQLHTFV